MVFAIHYDLREPNSAADYQRLIGAIKAYGVWAHFGESLWLIQTDATTVAIRDYLKGFVRPNDLLFVAALTGSWASLNAGQERHDWLHSRVF
jgi:hypothetical protein